MRVMPTPKRWGSDKELITDMRNCDWKGSFAERRIKCAQSDWQSIVQGAVGANTFRAFTRLPNRPSVVFREWAYKSLEAGGEYFSKLSAINSQLEYDEWLNEYAGTFRRAWRRQMGSEIPFGPSMKLPNLLMKSACLWRGIPKSRSNRLIWYLHVPLDSFTIQAVRDCTDPGGTIGRIPASAGMGYVKDIGTYLAFQELMRSLSGRANVPPIAIDILAWDVAH